MDDWLEHPELLPPRPRSYIEEKYKMYFALDRGGMEGCDQFVFIVPNGLAVVGLAPSHALIRAHRQATDYQPLQLQYVPPPQGFIDAAALACMEDGEEGMPQAQLTAGERDAHVQHQGERDAGQEDTSLQQDAATTSGQGSHAPAPIKELRPCPSFSAEQLARVNFSSGKHDHSQTKLSGAKRKNQGTWLQPDQVICRVENSTGTRWVEKLARGHAYLTGIKRKRHARACLALTTGPLPYESIR